MKSTMRVTAFHFCNSTYFLHMNIFNMYFKQIRGGDGWKQDKSLSAV